MQKSATKHSDIARALLKAYGYNARTLAIDLDITISTARRLLYGKNSLKFNDLVIIESSIIGADVNFLFGFYPPGTMKVERECRAAAQEKQAREEAERQTKLQAQIEADQIELRNMTPQQKCSRIVSIIAPLLNDYKRKGCTISDICSEIVRQTEEDKKELCYG